MIISLKGISKIEINGEKVSVTYDTGKKLNLDANRIIFDSKVEGKLDPTK